VSQTSNYEYIDNLTACSQIICVHIYNETIEYDSELHCAVYLVSQKQIAGL